MDERRRRASTRYGAECDIYHCFEELDPPYVIQALKRLFKDRETLWLCDALMEYGVLIGAFFSAWFLHLVLQPLDLMIHQREYGVSHYLRQMDNFTIFASSKRKLRKLIRDIQAWLADVGLKLKDNWQVFRIGFTPRVEKAREQTARGQTAPKTAEDSVGAGLPVRARLHHPPKAQPVSAQAVAAFILLPKGSKPGHLV
ncbi:MAG: RNA-directed DNA polymerase [Flavonifractor plautii]